MYFEEYSGKNRGPTHKGKCKRRTGRPMNMQGYVQLSSGMIIRNDTLQRWMREARR